MRDALLLAVPLLRGLPLATTLALRVAGFGLCVVWTTSAAGFARARETGAAAWAPEEYEALALAVEVGRANGTDVARWCERKLAGRGVHVDARVAMQGADGLVPYFERCGEVRVAPRQYERVVLERVARTHGPGGAHVQQRSTLTFGELLARIGAEFVGVEVHERAAAHARDESSPSRARDEAALASI